ncbi:MAG: tetratricopeptide repeat protein [Chthonomonadaceae bacterium]|nr:tetratricopeptide repeat protein [Chthonomonadaceae bacterium]
MKQRVHSLILIGIGVMGVTLAVGIVLPIAFQTKGSGVQQTRDQWRHDRKIHYFDKLELAEQLSKSRDFENALRLLDEAEAFNPKSLDLLIALDRARLYERASNAPMAITSYEQAFELAEAKRNVLDRGNYFHYVWLLHTAGRRAERDVAVRKLVPGLLAEQRLRDPTGASWPLRQTTGDCDEMVAIMLLFWGGLSLDAKSPYDGDWIYPECARLAPRSPSVLIRCGVALQNHTYGGGLPYLRQAYDCATDADIEWLRCHIYDVTGRSFDEVFGK